MAKLPRAPQTWQDQPAAPSQETPGPDFDLNPSSRGLLDGWQSPDWNPEHSGLAFLHPGSIAQMGFGDKGDLHPNHAPASITDKLAQERRHLLPQDLNTIEQGTYQIAQAGGPLPYSLRQVPIPRFTPERMPGYHSERMDADGNVYDYLAEPNDIQAAMQDLAARGRQVQVGKDYEFEKTYSERPMLVDKNTKFWSAPNSFPLMGWRGDTYKAAQDRYYIDRNGDGTVDARVYQDPKTNVTMIDYGDGAGFKPYDPKKILPPPYAPSPPISPRHK